MATRKTPIEAMIARLRKRATQGQFPASLAEYLNPDGTLDEDGLESRIRGAIYLLKEGGASLTMENLWNELTGGSEGIVKERSSGRSVKTVSDTGTSASGETFSRADAQGKVAAPSAESVAASREMSSGGIARLLEIEDPAAARKALEQLAPGGEFHGLTVPENVTEHLTRLSQGTAGTKIPVADSGVVSVSPKGVPAYKPPPELVALEKLSAGEREAQLKRFFEHPQLGPSMRKSLQRSISLAGPNPDAQTIASIFERELQNHVSAEQWLEAEKLAGSKFSKLAKEAGAAGSRFADKARLGVGNKKTLLNLLSQGRKVPMMSGKAANRAGVLGTLGDVTELSDPEFLKAADAAAAKAGVLPKGFAKGELPLAEEAAGMAGLSTLGKLGKKFKVSGKGVAKGAGMAALLGLALQAISRYNESKEDRLEAAAHPVRSTADILEDLKVERAMQRRAMSEASAAGPQALKLLQSRLPRMTPSEVYIGPRPGQE